MKKTKTWVVCLSLLLCILLTVPVFASNDNKSTGEADGINTSMYDVSTALTAYVNNIVSPNRNEKHQTGTVTELNQFSSAQVGIAGAFVGYGDLKKNFKAFVTSSTSGSSSTSSYSSWLELDNKNSIYGYCRYGYLLKDLGLDATAPTSTGLNARSAFGFLLYVAYICASVVPMVFEMVFKILGYLNPFQFLTDSVNTRITDALVNVSNKSNAAKNITSFISDVYDSMSDMAWTALIPILYGIMIFNFFVLKSKGKGFSAMMKRMVFLSCGVFILAEVYTGVLTSMADLVSGEALPSTRIVAGTLIDFQSWAEASRLSPVTDLVSAGTQNSDATTDAGVAAGDTYRQLRSITYQTNKKTGVYNLSDFDFTGKNVVNGGVYNTSSGKQTLNSQTDDDKNDNTQKQIRSLIAKYGSNDFYQAASWEGAVNNVINQTYRDSMGSSSSTTGADSNDNTVYNMYSTTDEVKDWMNRDDSDNQAIFSGSSLGDGINWTTKDFNIFKNGTLTASGISPNSDVTYTSGSSAAWGNATDPSKKIGLSTISMYNYLTSNFSSSSIMNYSAQTTSSEYSKQAHYSANIVGGSSLSYVFGLNTIVTLGALIVIAFGYCFSLLVSNVRRGFTFLTSLPFAMLGVLRQILQVVILVFVMIAEILGSVCLYMVMGDLLTMVASIVETSIREYTGTILVGGVFGQIGLTVNPTVLANSHIGIVLAVFVETLLVFGLTVFFVKMKPYVLYVHNRVWNFVYRSACIYGVNENTDVVKPVIDYGEGVRV